MEPGLQVRLRVSRELEAATKRAGPVVVNLNYCQLRELPGELLTSVEVRGRLTRLYAKRNLITSLVGVAHDQEGRAGHYVVDLSPACLTTGKARHQSGQIRSSCIHAVLKYDLNSTKYFFVS